MPSFGGRSSRRSCVNCSEIFNEAKEKRSRRDGRQPWIARKLAVGIVVGIVGYAYYVYVVTFCIPMVQRHRNALGNKRIGIAFLVTFNVLFLMFVWTYARVVFTSPGYAVEHTDQTPPPLPRTPEPYQAENYNSATDSRAYDDDSYLTDGQNSIRRQSMENNINMSEAGQHHPRPSVGRPPPDDDDPQTSPVDALPPVAAGRANREIRHGEEEGLPPPFYSRRPPTHPVLLPEFRYCPRDGIVKPMRTHHCRACGTCIMKYDHHCPWIGQCVGAHNQKFFINFLQWSSTFTLFIFISILVMYARLGTLNPEPSVNAQHFVLLALSFLFTLFPVLLLLTQVYLVSYNLTTVEHLHLQRMQEREKGILSEMTGFNLGCSARRRRPRHRADVPDLKQPRWPWQAVLLRREIRRQWDQEWGRLGTEGNIWWLGSKRANWQAVMGKSKWGWFLPVGHSIGDGLSYPRNPRFDPEGRWRRRSEWPEGLR